MRLPVASMAALLALAAIAAAPPRPAGAITAPRSLSIEVDAREAPRHLLHARIEFDTDGAPLALSYPKWLQGDHGPAGPIGDVVGLAFEVNGQPVPWTRDSLDAWTVHVAPPPGRLVARLDFADVAPGTRATTAQLTIIPWNTLVLGLRGVDASGFRARASLRLPPGWTAESALTPVEGGARGDVIDYEETSLETLVDSPVLAGAHGRTIDLAPGHRIALYGDTPASIVAPEEQVAGWRRMVAETLALFGGRAPYRAYTFLVALSDEIAHYGLEHAESSEIRVEERTLRDDAPRLMNAALLSHEIAHAWNGKWRRPAGLLSPDFQAPMNTEMVWAYEGLTEYWGWLLAARAGLLTLDEAKDDMALRAAVQQARAGRAWRSLGDAGKSAHMLYEAQAPWTSLRRGTDFYGEGALLWFDVDATIRALTRGRRSLDDLAATFFSPPAPPPPGAGGPLAVAPYERADLVAALAAIAPHDWAAFLAERVDRPAARAPLGGIEQSGFMLAWRDSVTPYLDAYETWLEKSDLRFALGTRIDGEGTIDDVIPDSPAGRAGLAPGEMIVAINDRAFSDDTLGDALAATGRDSTARFELLVRNGAFFRRVALAGLRGDRRPWLAPRSGMPDGLARILAPRSPAPGPRRRR